MSEQGYNVLYRFRYFFGGLLIIVCLPLLSVCISFLGQGHAQATSSDSTQAVQSYDDNPNLVADGFAAASSAVSQKATSLSAGIQQVNSNVETTTLTVAKAIGNQSKKIISGSYTETIWVARGIAAAPVYTWHKVSSVAHIASLIEPASTSKTPVPVIDPQVAAEIANSKPILSDVPVANSTNAIPQWPIRGIITEEFGVPHWPYQPVHTGIDISDGAPAGVTPVRPFKPGRVVAVIESSYGFGNHVIVDHGGGLLSLYGHMYSTAVQVGQLVDKNTTLGLEGSTGLSTGVHVHFEVDLNGQPVNPHLYVPGQP